ncbi:efflux transporter outer membrane subunit [Chitinophaga sp. 30R24]|uniref:efflux transporter outer membrane subunit n=1 Tax=Chitinophaga sp. 30R24 TaxID=3248838 RepID=UPI003B914C9F
MNKRIHIYSMIAIAMLIASCRVGKEYQRPNPGSDVSFREVNDSLPAQKTATVDIAAIPWKVFFTDTTLQHLISQVLDKNYDLATALNNIRKNEEYLKQAKVEWLPAVTANVAANTNRFADNSLNGPRGFNLNNTIGANHIEDYSVSLGVSWEIDIWGKIKNQKEVALTTWLQSEEAAKSLQTRLISATAAGYYNLLILHEQLEIAGNNVALNDTIVSMTQLQMENGEATILAVQQAAIQKKKTQSLIPTLEQAIQIQENALNILMAHQPQRIHVNTDIRHFDIPDQFATGIPAELLNRRPDVRESEYALRAANARIGLAQANMYPALSISAGGGLNAFQAVNWLSLPASLFGNIAGGVLQPVFNKRRLKTNLNVTRIEYEQAVTNFKSKFLNAVSEVSDALVQSEKLKEKLGITQSQADILQTAMPNAQLLFTNGMASYLEVIAVEQSLLQNKLELADLKRQQVTAYIQLYRALGGGTQ